MDWEVFEKHKAFAGEKKPSMLRRRIGHDWLSILHHSETHISIKMAAPFGAAINYALCILNDAFFTALDLQRRVPYRPHYPRTS